MDSDEVCNEFHLRMTVATTEHERFGQLLSVLVPTPDTVVSPSNLEAINDARNIVVEAIGAVCDAYGRLDDCDDIDPDEARVMDDALATVQRWHEEIDQVMVQIRQVVWDSQHGHIRRLISGTHRRSGKRKAVEEVDTGCDEHVVEEFTEEPTEEPVEAEEEPEEDVPESEDEEPEEIAPTSEEEETVGESVGSEEEPTPEPVPEPVPEPAEEEPVPAEVPQTIPEEVYEKIRKEALNEGYAMGMQAALAQIAEVRKADETADEIAAESKPLGRRPRTSKPKTEKSETGEKPPKKGRGILRKKEATQ